MTFPAAVIGRPPIAGHFFRWRPYTHFIALEFLAFASATVFLMVMLKDALFLGKATMTHDTVLWVYPVFTYLADGLLHGSLPLWNPFSRGGEPLLPSYLQTRLFDPLDYLVIYIGALFTNDLTTLFNWDRVVRLLVAALGTQLLIRRWAKHPATRIALAFISVLSSMSLNIFHQCGFNDQFYAAPYIALFVFRILEGRRGWPNWMGVVFFLGPCLQSYFFVGSVTLVVVIVLGYAIFLRAPLADLLSRRETWLKLGISLVLLAVMTGPSLIMLLQQSEFQMSARTYPEEWQPKPSQVDGSAAATRAATETSMISMPYRFIRLTGTPVRPADLLGLLAPQVHDTRQENGTNPATRVLNGAITSDARLFIGGLAFAVALIGIVLARNRLKRIWLLALSVFGLLMMGPYTPAHELLYNMFPPLWLIRHTQQFSNFFLLALLFFFALGSDYLIILHRTPRADSERREYYWRSLPDRRFQPLRFALSSDLMVYALLAIVIAVAQAGKPEGMSVVNAASAHACIVALMAFAVVQAALTVVAWHRSGLSLRIHGSARGYHFAVLLSVSLASLLAIYSTNSRVTVEIGSASSFPVDFLALLAMGRSALAIAGLSLAVRQPLVANRSATSRTWWQVSESSLYRSLLSFLSEYRPLAIVFAIALSALAAYDKGLGEATIHAVRGTFTTIHGRHFDLCTSLLASLAATQLAFAILVWRLPASLQDVRIDIFRGIVATLASMAAIYIFATLPVPNSGHGVENIQRGPFSLPPFIGYPTTISILAAINLVLAASVFRAFFPVVLISAAAICAAILFADPVGLLLHIVLFVFLPVACAILLSRRRGRSHRRFAAACLIVVTAVELGQLATEYRPEIEVPRVAIKGDGAVAAGGQAFPNTRTAAIPNPPVTPDTLQPVRFPDLLQRRAIALGTPENYPPTPFADDVAEVLSKTPWNSFFTLKAYRQLIDAKLSPEVFASVFGIGAPIAQFRPNGQITHDFVADLQARSPESQLSALRHTVFLDAATLPPGWQPDPSNARPDDALSATKVAPVLAGGYNQAVVTVNSDRSGFIYFIDAFTQDWHATLNGVPTAVLRANGHFKAVYVPAGKSTVEFRYRPRILIWAISAFYAALTIAAFVALLNVAATLGATRGTLARTPARESP